MDQLVQHQQIINDQLARYGVKFGLYKNGTFQERLFPFDPLPRVITAQEFAILEKGLVQRVNALNLFLKDVYGDKKIIRDGIVPEDFVFAGSGYLPQCEGFVPPKGVYSHISGIDLVQAKDGSWFILEDNLRIPSGASYPLIARELCRRCSPETFSGNAIADDKGIYYFVPKMIKYYLGEEPILQNAPTYLPFYEEDRKYVLEHLETLVVKDVAEAGGYGVVFGRDMTKQQLEDFHTTIRNEPRRFIA